MTLQKMHRLKFWKFGQTNYSWATKERVSLCEELISCERRLLSWLLLDYLSFCVQQYWFQKCGFTFVQSKTHYFPLKTIFPRLIEHKIDTSDKTDVH